MSRTKRRRSSITWNEDESSSTTSKSTIAFMVKASASSSEDSDSEVSTSTSKVHTYEELQDAFDKLFKESQKLSKKYSKLKKQMEIQNEECSSFKEVINSLRLENSDLKTKVNDTSRNECTNTNLNSQLPCEKCKAYEEEIFMLEIENASLKTDLKTTSSNVSKTESLLKEANDKCKAKETQLHILENNLAKLSKAKSDLDTCLSVQRDMNDRTGLGFKQAFNKKKSKQFQKPFQKQRYQSRTSSITCNYCMKHGHISLDCNYRKFGVPQGYYTWVKKAPKGITNFRGPKTVWVPKYT